MPRPCWSLPGDLGRAGRDTAYSAGASGPHCTSAGNNAASVRCRAHAGQSDRDQASHGGLGRQGSCCRQGAEATFGSMAHTAADPEAELSSVRDFSPVLHSVLALVVLLPAMVLAVYKPRGVTPFGQR